MIKDIAITNAAALPSTELTDAAQRFLSASLSENTRRAYRAQFKKWSAWCETQDLAPIPAEPETVANFLADQATHGGHDGNGATVSTLRTIVAAIKLAHSLAGLDFNSQALVILKTLKGISRTKPQLPRQAEPIRGGEILSIIKRAGPLNADKRDAALLATGYIFALRRSELAALDYDKLGGGDGYIRITAKTIELTLARSKTSKGEPELVTVPRANNGEAIKAIENWITAANIKPAEPLIRSVNKSDTIGGNLTDQSINRIIKRAIAEYHIDQGAPEHLAREAASKVSGHSLRVGLATTAAEAGADIRAIASVTRHKSLDMPRRYAERADQMKTSPHNLPGVGLSASEEE